MKTYQIELKRTSYINLTIEAEDADHAEELAWKELECGDYNHEYASWDVESVEEINQGE